VAWDIQELQKRMIEAQLWDLLSPFGRQGVTGATLGKIDESFFEVSNVSHMYERFNAWRSSL